MNQILLSILFYFININFIFAQNSEHEYEKTVNNFINDLKLKSIDTIIIYSQYCIGCEIKSVELKPLKKEWIKDTYVIWKMNGKSYVQKYPFTQNHTSYINFDKTVEYILLNKKKFKSKSEYLRKNKFLPPNHVHDNYYELNIQIGLYKTKLRLSHTQVTEKFWHEFKWIPPTIEVVKLTKDALKLN